MSTSPTIPAPTPPPALNPKPAMPRVPHESGFDLRHFVLIFRERWLGATGLTLLLCGFLGYYMLGRPPIYTAKASLLVERSDRVVNMQQVENNEGDSALSDTLLLTHIEQMQSHAFYVRLVASFTPAEREALLEPYRAAPSYEEAVAASAPKPAAGDPKAADAPALPPPPTPEEVDRQLEGLVAGNLSAGRNKRTMLIDIVANHRDPRMAQLLANRAAEQYVVHLAHRSEESNSAATSFLGTEAEKLRKDVEDAENKLQAYKEKYNLVSVEDNQNVVADRLKTLSAQVTQAHLARLAADDKVQQVEDVVKNGTQQLQVAALAGFTSLIGVQNEIDRLNSERVVLAEKYGKNHPAMQANASSLEDLIKLRQQYLDAAVSDLKNQQTNAVTAENQIQALYDQADKDSLNLAGLSVEYNVLRRQVDTTRQTYAELLTRQNETSITSQLQNSNIKVVDLAPEPTGPTSPNPRRIAIILIMLGGIILCAYPILADTIDDRVKSWHDVESYLGTTLLGEISSATNVSENDRGEIVAKDSDEGVVEAFRGLHSQLLIGPKLEPPRTILITSTAPGEGKSFVSSNLAAAFAAHGNRTLLVDCDFRRPSQHRLAKLDNKLGVMKWLDQNVPPGDHLLADPMLGIIELSPREFLLRTGGSSRKISELLASGRLTSLFEALQRQFDIVIIDTPPAGVFPDSEIFARMADDLIYVCRFKGPRRAFARQVLTRFLKSEIRFAGVVLNAMPVARSQSYYYSGYGYYYSKNYKKYYKEYRTDDEGEKKKKP